MSREKFLQQAIRVLLVIGFLAGCGSIGPTPVAEAPTEASVPEQATATPTPTTTPEPPDKFLFIGNSVISKNGGVNNHFEQLAASANPPRVIKVDEVMMGGATLKTLWEDSPARYLINLLGKGTYDVVVLQEDIPWADPATGVDTFHKYARLFDAEIKKTGARPVLFMAWSYEQLDWISMDEIAQAHRDIATELGIDVAPVGLAFQRAMKERPELDMYDTDREHSSIYGTYLATSVIYATVFEESPSGLSYLPPGRRGITEEEAAFLQRIAWETVQGYQAQ